MPRLRLALALLFFDDRYLLSNHLALAAEFCILDKLRGFDVHVSLKERPLLAEEAATVVRDCWTGWEMNITRLNDSAFIAARRIAKQISGKEYPSWDPNR